GGGDASGAGERVAKLPFPAHRLHPDAATTGDRLDHRRVVDRARRPQEGLVALIVSAISRYDRHLHALRDRLRLRLVAEAPENARWRAYEPHASGIYCAREFRSLRKESVPRMHEVGFRFARGGDHAIDR